MNSDRDKQFEYFENEFKEIVKKHLNINFNISTQGSSRLDDWLSIKLIIPQYNFALENIDYFEKPKSFYHFTNLRVLYSILQEKAMRMYNLNKSNDPEEYKYASKILKSINNPTILHLPYESQLKTMREYTFILSSTLEENIKSSSFWESNYVDQNTGVAIEFEILNDPQDWQYFYSSKVKYGQIEKFEIIRDEIMALETKYKNHTLNVDISPIISFHKNKIKWQHEKEFRIVTHFPNQYKEKIYQDYHHDEISKGRITKYIKLPIYTKNTSDFIKTKPLLKLKNLFFAKNFTVESDIFPRFVEKLNNYIHESIGYNFKEFDLQNNKIQ